MFFYYLEYVCKVSKLKIVYFWSYQPAFQTGFQDLTFDLPAPPPGGRGQIKYRWRARGGYKKPVHQILSTSVKQFKGGDLRTDGWIDQMITILPPLFF